MSSGPICKAGAAGSACALRAASNAKPATALNAIVRILTGGLKVRLAVEARGSFVAYPPWATVGRESCTPF